MTLRLSLALLATLLSVPAALAVPTLKGDITVNKAIVTIGDMFDDAGNLAETGIFMAPAPGTTGVVPLADLTRAATLAGLTEFENVGYSRVRVARASTLVDAALLDGLIGADLERRGIVSGEVTAALRFNVADVSFNAEAVADPATLVSLRYTPGNNGFSARFMIAGIDEPVDLDGTIQLMTRAPRLAKTLPTGTILSQGDFELADVPLATADAGGYADISQLVGKQLVRQARGGIMLKATDVTEPKVVKTYPASTHAHTVEFVLKEEARLNSLFQSLERGFRTGQGRIWRRIARLRLNYLMQLHNAPRQLGRLPNWGFEKRVFSLPIIAG